MKLLEVILHTGGKTEGQIRAEAPELSDPEIQIVLKMNALMDGQKAIAMPNPKDTEYWLAGIEDKAVDKEVSYLMEQDPMFGCFIDQRAEFDKAYDSGDYAPDFIHIIEKSQAGIIRVIAKAKNGAAGDSDA